MADNAADLNLDDTFTSLNPATDEVIATLPIHDEADVANAVIRARAAASWWRDLGFDGRRRRLQAFKGRIARASDQLAELTHIENGKPHDDALLEVFLVTDHLDWAARNAEKLMRPRRVGGVPLLQFDHVGHLEYKPVGVVGVIGPWNYPMHTPMGSISYALAAGNAVIFKPSEYTPSVGLRMAELFAEVVDEEPVFQVLTGLGQTGAALCRAKGVDVLAFTGSASTGRKVLAEAAQNLTKVVMECGGKDAMLVDRDANIRKAAEAALWAGCANGGQTCAGVERVYVHTDVWDDFTAEIVEQAEHVRAGHDVEADYGPMTMPSQIDIVQRHLQDALDSGARALVGGIDSIRPPYIDPIVLVDVPMDSPLMTEETFGPIVPLVRVPDMDEAVRLANDSTYGLGATVFSRRSGMDLARAINAGMVSVNSVLRFAALPELPFGGHGESGYGRIHGVDGLREFTTARAISRRRLDLGLEFASFERPKWLFQVADQLNKVLHGRDKLTK